MKYQHNFTDELMAYASYDRGWRGGAANIAGAPQPPVFGAFDAEESDNFELGFKWSVMEGRGFGPEAVANLRVGSLRYQGQKVYVSSLNKGGETVESALAPLTSRVRSPLRPCRPTHSRMLQNAVRGD